MWCQVSYKLETQILRTYISVFLTFKFAADIWNCNLVVIDIEGTLIPRQYQTRLDHMPFEIDWGI